MAKTTCPYCYRGIRHREIKYLCSGRSAPGYQPCSRSRDSRRELETGFQGEMRPVFSPPGVMAKLRPGNLGECPTCHASSGVRACPHCHTPLPPGFAAATSPLIAMVGAYGAGKTVYLSVLAQQLRNTLGRRFDADIRLSGDRQGEASSGLDWLQQNVDSVFEDHRLFPATQPTPDGRKEPVVYEWRRRGALGVSTSYLSFYDTAGEDLGGQDSARDLKYLASADALLLMLDPFTLRAAREEAGIPDDLAGSRETPDEALARVTTALLEAQGRVGKQVKIPVAATFAKIDAFFGQLGPDHPIRQVGEPTGFYDEAAGSELHEHVRALLHDWGGDRIDDHLRTNYSRFRYFPVSALGEPPDYQNATVSERGVRPLRVEEPLLWLLSQFNVVPARRRSR